MIEVEKKFLLSDSDRATLLDGATSLGTKKFTDVYYDTPQYDLTKKDWWLRSRDGRFELKIPAGKINRDVETNQYEELEHEPEIKERLNIHESEPLADILPRLGYHPFVTMTTTRAKYKKEEFTIDVDAMDFGYDVAEIEVMLGEKEGIEDAKKRIFAFAERNGLVVKPVRGKVLEYLARHDREHLDALATAWGVAL